MSFSCPGAHEGSLGRGQTTVQGRFLWAHRLVSGDLGGPQGHVEILGSSSESPGENRSAFLSVLLCSFLSIYSSDKTRNQQSTKEPKHFEIY